MATLRAKPAADISILNTYIAQEENYRRRPLVAIHGDAEGVTLELDDAAEDKPQTNTVLTTGRPPAGAITIGNFEIFVGGRPVVVTAYRPAPPAA